MKILTEKGVKKLVQELWGKMSHSSVEPNYREKPFWLQKCSPRESPGTLEVCGDVSRVVLCRFVNNYGWVVMRGSKDKGYLDPYYIDPDNPFLGGYNNFDPTNRTMDSFLDQLSLRNAFTVPNKEGEQENIRCPFSIIYFNFLLNPRRASQCPVTFSQGRLCIHLGLYYVSTDEEAQWLHENPEQKIDGDKITKFKARIQCSNGEVDENAKYYVYCSLI